MGDLTATQWRLVETVYEGAVEIEIGSRTAFLARACAGDAAVQREVEAMLGARSRSSSFMESPVIEVARRESGEAGRLVGPYRLICRIGTGGMGSVWLAKRDDEHFTKQVAVKLIKRGMDTDDILRRFRLERQVLANLEHPNIARLLDGGSTDDGLPYLVMEYVDGVPIDRYCDEHGLGVTERLELFRSVCAAVGHAHRNLVVHRDLKPGNILVERGTKTPKLLDFGIAKVLGAEGSVSTLDVTVTEARLLTPRYASPEQVRGETITTASDVYTLGVILYELLTGRLPYDVTTRSRSDFERVICEQEPRRPSTAVAPATRGLDATRLRRRLSGDLDTILLAALRKDPARRYASVEALSEDIRRHNTGLPVLARPDTFLYRSGKFIRRNRMPVAAATVVCLAVVTGLIASSRLWMLAEVARREAEHLAYTGNLQAAEAALRDHDMVTARRHLELAPGYLRGGEWTLLHGRLDRSDGCWIDPGEPPNYISLDLSPDGTLLAGGTNRGTIQLWDTATGTLAGEFGEHVMHVRDLAWSPDGASIATASGSWVAGRTGPIDVKLWDVATGELIEPVMAGHPDSVQTVAFSPDGASLASGCAGGVVCIWDVAGHALLRRIEAHDSKVWAVAFSPDGRELASVSTDETLALWDTDTWTLRRRVVVERNSQTQAVTCVAYAPGGDVIATGSASGDVRLWNAGTGALRDELVGHDRYVSALAFDSAGTRLVSASVDRTLRVWTLDRSRGPEVLLGESRAVNDICISGDGHRIFAAGEARTIRVWGLGSDVGRTYLGLGGLRGVAINPDGTLFAASWGRGIHTRDRPGSGIGIFDLATGAELQRIAGHLGADVTSIAWHPDGTRLVSTSATLDHRGIAHVWDAGTGERLFSLEGHDRQIWHAAYDAGGDTIATAALDGTVRLWSSTDGRPLGHAIIVERSSPVALCYVHGGSELAVGRGDGGVEFWDPVRRVRLAASRPHGEDVTWLAERPDGAVMLSASEDGTVVLWDVLTHQPGATLAIQGDRLRSAAFTPDGSRILASTQGGSLTWWDAADGRTMLTMRDAGGAGLAFTPDGRLLLTDSGHQSVRVWDMGTLQGARHARD